jgi:hypothetical protein
MPPTPTAEPTPRRLAAMKPTTIALMHGPTFKDDGVAALEEHYRKSRCTFQLKLQPDEAHACTQHNFRNLT